MTKSLKYGIIARVSGKLSHIKQKNMNGENQTFNPEEINKNLDLNDQEEAFLAEGDKMDKEAEENKNPEVNA